MNITSTDITDMLPGLSSYFQPEPSIYDSVILLGISDFYTDLKIRWFPYQSIMKVYDTSDIYAEKESKAYRLAILRCVAYYIAPQLVTEVDVQIARNYIDIYEKEFNEYITDGVDVDINATTIKVPIQKKRKIWT